MFSPRFLIGLKKYNFWSISFGIQPLFPAVKAGVATSPHIKLFLAPCQVFWVRKVTEWIPKYLNFSDVCEEYRKFSIQNSVVLVQIFTTSDHVAGE